MKFQSTRGSKITADSCEAVLNGLAADGGLYMPVEKEMQDFDWKSVLDKDTYSMASSVLSALLPDFSAMPALVEAAYNGRFETPELTPLVPVGDKFVLELFRGPTSAFKDVALSMLPQLMSAARSAKAEQKETLILTATSGDTGKAALAGFRDVPGVRILVFYPADGVSAVQKAQMVTQEGSNVRVCAVRGNFDDTQSGVKRIFSACEEEKLLAESGVALSSANSINIGRLAPQTIYYFKAYAELCRRGRIRCGDKVDYCVPTGNFGDILAGYFAKKMGLPVGTLVCASNANRVLTDFFSTGCYDRRRTFHKTSSPSMDILISSNLERLLYLMCDGDAAAVAGLMRDLQEKGQYTVPEAIREKLDREFWAGCCGEKETETTIGRLWQEDGYLCDPHTAVAWNVAQQYAREKKNTCPMVVLSTASPYKFPATVLRSLGEEPDTDEFAVMRRLFDKTGVPIPAHLADLAAKTVRYTDCIGPEEMLDYVLRYARDGKSEGRREK